MDEFKAYRLAAEDGSTFDSEVGEDHGDLRVAADRAGVADACPDPGVHERPVRVSGSRRSERGSR